MDRKESKAVPPSEDPPPEGWKRTCILTWGDEDVQEWLESKRWKAYFPPHVPDAETLAIRTENRFKHDIGDHGVAQDIFDAITVNLEAYGSDTIDPKMFAAVMKTRGTPVTQPQQPQQDASAVKRRKIDVSPVISALISPLNPQFDGYNHGALKDLLHQPWPQECKIPLSPARYDEIISLAPSADNVVYKIGEEELGDTKLEALMCLIAMSAAFKRKETVDDIHFGHDLIFTELFACLQPHIPGVFDQVRNASQSGGTSTVKPGTRPDMSKVYQSMLIYEAEEKKEGSTQRPEDDLITKLGEWSAVSRGTTSFLLCHGALGWKVTFYAMVSDGRLLSVMPDHEKVFNFQIVEHRFTALKIAVNAFRIGLWQALHQPCARLTIPVVGELQRNNCVLERNGNGVLKTVNIISAQSEKGGMARDRVDRLHRIVKIVESMNFLHCSSIDTIMLSPRSLKYTIRPLMFESQDALKSQDDVVDAIRAVLAALAALHANGILHNDIRWPNVMKCPKTGWKLTDFDHASEGDGTYLDHHHGRRQALFDKFQGLASTISDLYAVGDLIYDTELGTLTLDDELKEFGSQLREQQFASAQIALNVLNGDEQQHAAAAAPNVDA